MARRFTVRRRAFGVLFALLLLGLVALPGAALAANPSPSPGAAGDTRSAGEGPGIVGAPGLAILGVLGLGVGTAALTLAYVRLSARSASRPES